MVRVLYDLREAFDEQGNREKQEAAYDGEGEVDENTKQRAE